MSTEHDTGWVTIATQVRPETRAKFYAVVRGKDEVPAQVIRKWIEMYVTAWERAK